MQAIECHAATKYFFEKNGKPDGNASRSGWNLFARREKRKIVAVEDVSFEVKPGEIFGIIGPNGSGKSTLIRMISTLIIPDAGTLCVFGVDVVKNSMQVRKVINRVSVEAAFFKKLSAWENLSYAARLYGISPAKAKIRATEILETMNFKSDRMFNPLENLSRGMQQKVAIARALLTSPALLLLDEPTTGLDPVSKKQVQDFVLQIHKIQNTTIVLTSHDMTEVEHLCGRVAIINEGRFIECDTPENLKARYSKNGTRSTLEEIFSELTGKKLETDHSEV